MTIRKKVEPSINFEDDLVGHAPKVGGVDSDLEKASREIHEAVGDRNEAGNVVLNSQSDNISENSNISDNSKGIDDSIDGWLINPVTPWRRYGARFLDISINGILGVLLLSIAWYSIAPLSAQNFFSALNPATDILLTVFMSIIISGILTGFSGTTIGKWIFGIRVTMPDGSTIGIINGIARDFGVWVKGLALGIPIISFITMYMSYNRLKNKGSTSWDHSEGYVVTHRPNGWIQYALNVLGVLLIITTQALSRMIDQL